jgi:hypothetical protein
MIIKIYGTVLGWYFGRSKAARKVSVTIREAPISKVIQSLGLLSY